VIIGALQACDLARIEPTAGDACTLEVVFDASGTRTTIQPPYAVTLAAPDASGFQGGISFQGSGWQQVDVVVIRPDGVIGDTYRDEAGRINDGSVAFPLDGPGTWRFKLSDARAGCRREFTVAARAASVT
jgi:hypothetical protein